MSHRANSRMDQNHPKSFFPNNAMRVLWMTRPAMYMRHFIRLSFKLWLTFLQSEFFGLPKLGPDPITHTKRRNLKAKKRRNGLANVVLGRSDLWTKRVRKPKCRLEWVISRSQCLLYHKGRKREEQDWNQA